MEMIKSDFLFIHLFIIDQGGTSKIYGKIYRNTEMIRLIPKNPEHKVIELSADQVKIKAVYVETIGAKR